MLFSPKVWALLALMSSTVTAAGSDVHFECPAAVAGDPALIRCQATARHLKRLELKGCNLIACIGANAGVAVACATAVAMDILDPIADSLCLAAISGAFKECEDCI